MTHDHDIDVRALLTADFWDERYGSVDQLWSGNPNPRLVEHVAGLVSGTALDVGCGEGADAIWLARQGWHVTAMDVSTVALARAATHAAQAGAEIAERVVWEQADLLTWNPAPRRFDLVSAQFIHLPQPARESFHRRLAAAVNPGGALLIVGHHPSDLETSVGRWPLADLMFTADQIAPVLNPDDWEIVAADAPARQARDPEDNEITIHDAVLFARRR